MDTPKVYVLSDSFQEHMTTGDIFSFMKDLAGEGYKYVVDEGDYGCIISTHDLSLSDDDVEGIVEVYVEAVDPGLVYSLTSGYDVLVTR